MYRVVWGVQNVSGWVRPFKTRSLHFLWRTCFEGRAYRIGPRACFFTRAHIVTESTWGTWSVLRGHLNTSRNMACNQGWGSSFPICSVIPQIFVFMEEQSYWWKGDDGDDVAWFDIDTCLRWLSMIQGHCLENMMTTGHCTSSLWLKQMKNGRTICTDRLILFFITARIFRLV